MSRLLDLKPDDEAEVVTRVVRQIHRVMDDLLAEGSDNPERFRKTVFNQNEDTLVDRPKKIPLPPELSEPNDAVSSYEFDSPAPPQLGRSISKAKPHPGSSDLHLTNYAELEYSSMNALGSGHTGMSNGRKLLLVGSIILIMSMVTAYMAYQLLDP